MTSKRVSPVNCSDSAITSQTSNGSNTSSTQRRLATVSPSTSPRSTSFYGSSPSNVTSGQYWAPVASRGSKFKTWSKGGYDKKGPQGSVQLTSTGTSTTPSNNMPLNPSQPNVPNSSQQSKPKRERPTTKSMSIQSFEAHQQKLEQINRSEQNPAPRATTPPFLHRDRRPRSQSTNSSTKSPKQTQFYRKKKPMLVDAVTQTSTDASTQTSEDDFELAMSLYRKSPYPETFQSISAPCSTPTTNTVSTQTNTFAVDPSILKVPAKERITATASMQRSLSTNTMNIQINLQEFEELQKQLTKFQQHKEALLSKSRPLSFTAVPVPTAVKINSVNITFPQAQITVPQPQTPQPQVPIPQPLPQAHVVPIEVPQPPCVEEEEVEQLGPSQKLFSADAVLSDLEDLEEEIAFMRYKALSLQESVQWLQREKSSRPIAPGPPPPVEFTDSKTLAVNTPVKKVEPNKPEKRPNTPFDFMPDLQGPDQSKRQNIASQGSAFTTGASIGARLNKTRMSQSLTALPDLKM